jgi:hypothetical protein
VTESGTPTETALLCFVAQRVPKTNPALSREALRDQDQVVEIAEFHIQNSGESRRDQADG